MQKSPFAAYLRVWGFLYVWVFRSDIEKLQAHQPPWPGFADSIFANGQSQVKSLSENLEQGCHPGPRSGISPGLTGPFEILKRVQDDTQGGFRIGSKLDFVHFAQGKNRRFGRN